MTPPSQREVKTKTDLAVALGVSRTTLYEWENSDEFQRELRKLRGVWGARYHGEILGKLLEIVQSRSDNVAVAAAKTLLQHLDLPREEEKQEANVSSETLEAIRAALRAEGIQVIDGEV